MSDFEVHIRPARAGDAPALVQLFAQLGYATDEDAVRAQLDHFGRGAHALVAELASHRLAGVATVAVHPRLYTRAPSAQLTALVTDRKARRHGVGKALTRAAAELARAAGCEKLYVRTNRRRHESPPFYKSLGFLETHLTFDLPLGAKAGDGPAR
ncbi:MAG TPA: GNAT family N-acetyltransferase [Myxococcaceae bacterium]|nr:GNAT family N-acetyltransferase [Myxococcaceae bacterium]